MTMDDGDPLESELTQRDLDVPHSQDASLDTTASKSERPERGSEAKLPERIGRYRVERVLGQGGFGIVYLAHDETLHRPVAIKVPHRTRATCDLMPNYSKHPDIKIDRKSLTT